MQKFKLICFSLLFFILFNGSSQQLNNHLTIKRPSIEQEASSIWRTINDIEFLERQGYKIHLPKNDSIQFFVNQSRNKTFSNADYRPIYNLVESNIYNPHTYNAALIKTKASQEQLNTLIKELKEVTNSWAWNFKLFDVYSIVFTLYGTGGSYDAELGSITLFTNSAGDFMNYKEPTNTIIHEIIHIGIEESIVQKYNLPHGLKERIVDRITYLLFSKQLTAYKLQHMGNPEIDNFIKNKKDLETLNVQIEQYLNQSTK